MENFEKRLFSRRSILAAGGAVGGFSLLGGGLLSACSPSESETDAVGASGEPRYGGRIRLGIIDGDRAGDLDVHKPIGTGSVIRGFALYDKLWEWSSDMEPTLALAEHAEVASDASHWTIRLKPGLEFHNGKTITADDVIFSIKRLSDPELASPYGSLISVIDRNRVIKLDERTVRVHFNDDRGFLALPETWVNFGGIVPEDYHPVTNPVGAGPYKLKDYRPGQRALLTRFENYYKPGRPYADEIEIIEFKDQTSRIAALLSGQVDVINAILPEHLDLLRDKKRARIINSKTNGWQSFDLNTTHPAFKDVRVRKAFRLFVDRQDLVTRALQGQGRVANDLYSPQDAVFNNSIPQRDYDPEQAKQLLRDAGQENLSLELVTSPLGVSASLVFAEQAKKVGVEIKVKQVDFANFNSGQYKDWAITTNGMLGLPYLAAALHSDAPTAVANKTFFSNERFSELITKALATPDFDTRKVLLQEAQEIQHNEGGLVIWGFANVLDAASPRVGGLEPEHSHFPTWRFDRLWLA